MPLAELIANFGYYVRLMIGLAAIAYSDHMSTIPAQVDSLGWQVVWGPSELSDELGISYSRAFIAKSDTADVYTVVIRGTNPISWRSWMGEDFDVGTTVPFDTLWPLDTLPANSLGAGRISQGTFNGMSDLLKLTDPSTGTTILQFLQAANPGNLYVTGHSLGGTLTPPLFAYLDQVLYGGQARNMAPFSFAGLTPGDTAFNRYLAGMINPDIPWRFHNTLDIAPQLWESYAGLENIYVPHDLRWGMLEADLLTNWFNEANGRGYAQPAGGCALAGVFRYGFLDMDGSDWTNQAIHQHHSGTYARLVDAAFPDPDTPPTACAASTALRFRGIREREAHPAIR